MHAGFPVSDPTYTASKIITYPITINGKLRANITCAIDEGKQEVTKQALHQANIQKWIQNKPIKKVIFVPNRMINIVL